jgi:copper resistance protein D
MSVTGALALCRFAHFLAAMLAFGVSASLGLYAPRALRGALTPALRRLMLAVSLVALATAILWLSLEAASMADDWRAAADPGVVAAVLTDTEFGQVWIAHLALAAALVAAALLAPSDGSGVIAVCAGLLSASLGLVDHAAMQSGAEGVLHRMNDAVHLLMAGAWLGGLIAFLAFLDAYRKDDHRRDAVSAMMRFSFTGHFIVAAIVATGIVNIALIGGHPPWPPDTPYRALLVAKILIVALMITIAAFNRYALVPRLQRKPAALAALRHTARAEVALGAVVVALVSVFGLLNPE